MSDGNILNDTMDIISSDIGQTDNFNHHKGSIQAQTGERDPYTKIKQHALLALKNLFRNNSKVIYHYWNILFPSFMMRPKTEFSTYLKDMTRHENHKKFM